MLTTMLNRKLSNKIYAYHFLNPTYSWKVTAITLQPHVKVIEADIPWHALMSAYLFCALEMVWWDNYCAHCTITRGD